MMRALLAAFVASLWTTVLHADDTLRLSVTTSFHNSGLSDILLPEIAQDTGIDVQLLVVGTGQALRLGRAGDVDAILVHSRAAEEQFIADGFGTHRREIMYNDFVFVGPQNDPANIAKAGTAVQALQQVAAQMAGFVSRGDDSGTHKMELQLWSLTGTRPEGPWYRAVGAGMGAALNTAVGLDAYILTDRASWLNFGNRGQHGILFQGDPLLFNQYAFLPVNSARHPHVKAELVQRLERWLVSDKAKRLIDGYTLEGEQLFTFNAVPD